MESLVDRIDFPASNQIAYLNTASVCLVYKDAHETTVRWMQDLADGYDIRIEQELLGHKDVRTAMVYAHILHR